MQELVWIALFLPLVSAIGLTIASPFLTRTLTGLIASISIFLSFLGFVTIVGMQELNSIGPINTTLYHWLHLGNINADFSVHIDHLSLLMTLIITGVGFLIHVYSIGYMEHEEGFVRYFACMNFFVFSMLLLVLAGNLLLLFIGWEGVGLASYLLIGYYYSRPSAAQAATKAFVVNRMGDLGLLLGIILTFYLFGTTDIDDINQRAGLEFSRDAPILIALTLLYFWGAVGKSAQLPLYVWLPDAMEGPTPVSALIHAATMVTAGVYLMVRMHPMLLLAPTTLTWIGIVGGITSLFAALCAVAQTDLKRVLAYSTISQLGLMFLACGVGAFYAAMFHLTTHAFVKGLLFLAAGNVVHMMHGTTDMQKMGGLSKNFPVTHWLFLIGVLAMSGIPPLAAFFSKDLILETELLAGFYWLFAIAILTSLLTGFYLTRAYFLTFRGETRVESRTLQIIREAPKVMLIPVAILAALSIVGGFLGFAFGRMPILESFLDEVGITWTEHEFSIGLLNRFETWFSIFIAFLGVGAAAILYTKYQDRLGPSLTLLRKAFYVDEIYSDYIVRPLRRLSQIIVEFFEPRVFEASIHRASQATQTTAVWLQKIQSGQIRSYIAWMAVGMVFLMAYLFLEV